MTWVALSDPVHLVMGEIDRWTVLSVPASFTYTKTNDICHSVIRNDRDEELVAYLQRLKC